MNCSDWGEPPAADNLDYIKTLRNLKELSNPLLNGITYFYDMGNQQIYGWDDTYFHLVSMDLVGIIKKYNKME